MERLTKQLGDGRIVATDGVAFVRNAKYGSFFEGRALEKLAAYEDAEERGMFGKWIPISERQPEDDKYIMLSFDNFTLPDMKLTRTETVHFIRETMKRVMPHMTYLSTHGCHCRNAMKPKRKTHLQKSRRPMQTGSGA